MQLIKIKILKMLKSVYQIIQKNIKIHSDFMFCIYLKNLFLSSEYINVL